MTAPGPITPRSRLRLWSDRMADRVLNSGARRRGRDRRSLAVSSLFAFLYVGPALLAGLFVAWGMLHTWQWWLAGVAVALLPLRRAIRPVLRDSLILPLDPRAYALIEAMAEPSWMEVLANWAEENPHFDTRHLDACRVGFKQSPRGDIKAFKITQPFKGQDAMDLFDGQIGRLVEARRQERLGQSGSRAQGEPPTASRRL